jgi:hypothetical protein
MGAGRRIGLIGYLGGGCGTTGARRGGAAAAHGAPAAEAPGERGSPDDGAEGARGSHLPPARDSDFLDPALATPDLRGTGAEGKGAKPATASIDGGLEPGGEGRRNRAQG